MKLFFVLTIMVLSLFGNAQHTGTTGDMRNFAAQTQVVYELNPFGKKGNVVGSQFLFADWVKGKVINREGVEFTAGLFNFNKMSQSLFIQLNDTSKTVAFQVDKRQLKSIYLSDETGSYLLEKVAALDTNSFYRAIAKGSKYSLYSLIKTKFIPSNYESNGIVSSGNLYDEYKDEVTYYVVFANGSVHEISLKKKSVKSVFEAEKEKVDQFYKASADDEQNEDFLSRLVTSLNQ
ncbi:MAG: hypothetical protein Q8941_17550 [Bacteroidota bacterium]|nr:hypothetical protein [Bacteroidota bacterium]